MLSKYRRPGVNVGDVVRIKPAKIADYQRVYDWLSSEDPLDVVFREATSFNHSGADDRGGYVVHLRRKDVDATIVAKPSHLAVVRKSSELMERS